ncbi:YoaH family protein [Photorhabdus temperata]|uniref:UPF0181 protein MEG1DRAFT_01306 n=3 Tax=Photorhabdus TaxID=29487 RepID=A0A081RZC3_PHOTE|nr:MULTISPECIES: YoaH family protein [Photorhabdus]EQC00626.1 hypothetical protein B738_10016 [Photorhabdus temperata subsp. temperata M1021]ERT14055.1 hypothetical protein O185_05795 [Photorhabdus temperata J3]KER04026.1 hypothetical protein MEG1DRAFT_01306 [Photorhabdus temperata subsp. temperata Meg1]MCT8347682.1 YoaH family protein [Photorhabdus temperata]NHB86758.1 YoaH family protein [Photorhabdus tasmaniensis]
MFSSMPTLSHQEQQLAVEKIQQLMAEGMSSGEAIGLVAQEIREQHRTKEQVNVMFDDEKST